MFDEADKHLLAIGGVLVAALLIAAVTVGVALGLAVLAFSVVSGL